VISCSIIILFVCCAIFIDNIIWNMNWIELNRIEWNWFCDGIYLIDSWIVWFDCWIWNWRNHCIACRFEKRTCQ
jgi:hypothetical protein